MSFQSQPPESSGNGKTTRKKGGRDPPDVSLDYIVNDLLSYFNEIKELRDAKTEAENKYGIKNEHVCWPEDDIKRAWGKTQRMEKESSRRRHWTLVIMLQIIERQIRKGLFNMTEVGHLVQRYGELSLNNTPDAGRENGRREDDRQSTVDMSQACGNSTFNKTDEKSENPSKEKLQKGAGTGEIGSEKSNSQTVYIKIPLSALSDSELKDAGQNVSSPYKFIDGYPDILNRPTVIRRKKSYVTSYNKETKNAEWVYEILNRSTLADNHIDLSLGKCMQNVGFQQGHLAAAANHPWCQEAYNSTFCFSNISPQFKELNKCIWFSLENACRDKITNDEKQKNRNIHVYTGPVLIEDVSESSGEEWSSRNKYKSKRAAPFLITSKRNPKKKKTINGVSENVKEVPTQFFKVIIVENYNGTVEKPVCYLIPNDKKILEDIKKVKRMVGSEMKTEEILQNYEKPLEVIERLSGLKFTAETSKKGGTDCIKTVKWEGEGGNGEKCTAEIKVRISQPHT